MAATVGMMGNRKLSEHEIVSKLYSQNQRAKSHDLKNWNRWQKNIRTYWGIDNELGLGQWPASTVGQLIEQGRQIGAYNLCKPSVNNFAGEILQSPFGFKFSPVDGEETSTTDKLNAQIYIDKDICDWRSTELPNVVNGLIMRSDIRMEICDEYLPKKYIKLVNEIPGAIIYDPDWNQTKSKECKWCDRESYLSAQEILDIYGTDNEKYRGIVSAIFKSFGEQHLQALADWEALYGAEYGPNTGVVPCADRPEVWGSKYKVIEHFEMYKIKRKYEYVVTEDGDEIEIPADLPDPAAKLEWLNTNVPGWVPDQVFEDSSYDKIQYVSAYCPGLSLSFLLAHGPTDVQCGRLQFFPWSAYRMHGEYGGILDAIIDAQQNINYWESLIINKIQIEGGGGSQFVDPSMFKTPEELERYKTSRNVPSETFELKPNALRNMPNGPAVPTSKSQFPHEVYEHLKHIIDIMWPKLSGVTPASRGESESATEPGILYRMKKLQSQVERYVIHESLRNWYNELAEAYMFQHIHMRSGKKIEFYDRKSKKSVVWNDKKTVVDDFGRSLNVIIDPVHKLKSFRHKVDIVESADSPSRKDEIIQGAAAVVKAINPATTPLTVLDLTIEIVKNVDVFDDDQKARLDDNFVKERELAMQQLSTNKAALRLQELQANVQVMQLENQIKMAQAGVQPGAVPNGQPGVSNDVIGNAQPQPGAQGMNPEGVDQLANSDSSMAPQEQLINV